MTSRLISFDLTQIDSCLFERRARSLLLCLFQSLSGNQPLLSTATIFLSVGRRVCLSSRSFLGGRRRPPSVVGPSSSSFGGGGNALFAVFEVLPGVVWSEWRPSPLLSVWFRFSLPQSGNRATNAACAPSVARSLASTSNLMPLRALGQFCYVFLHI